MAALFSIPGNPLNPSQPTSGWPRPPSIVAAREGLARSLALLVVALTMVLFVSERLMGLPLDADSLLGLGLGAIALLSWGLLRRQHYEGVAWLLVASLLTQASASAYFFGSVRTVNIWLIVVAQIGVGIFLSRRSLVWTTLGVILLIGLLTWADAQGLLKARIGFDVGLRTWMMQVACLLGVAAMVYLNRIQMRTAQQQQLQEANQRLQAQLERDHGMERFSRIFFSSPTPIFVQSARTGHILDVNQAFEQVTGYSREAVLNRRDAFLWLQDASHEAFVQNRRSQWRTGWQPITGLCANGQELPLMICSERDEDPDDSLVITVLRLRGEEQDSA
ncbi:PAS domain S-box protein [Hydrogenophaga sp. PAMC20947]|nr:PAS domain S-box protein [Hydrogenophaga sp. PAMC20947]